MARANTTRRITIAWDRMGAKIAKETVSSLKSIDKNAKKVSSTVNMLRNAFAGWIGLQGLQTLAQWSDSLQLLRDRMSVFTGSTESATMIMNELQGAAAFTKTSIDGLAESYNRIALSTKDLGLSTDAILGSTIALQQTFRLSGSTIAEATSSTIQLSQGLAAGALRGQELRSVLEANAVLGGLLAKEFDVTRGELIKLGETGRITSDKVMKVLANNFEELNKQASNLSLTFSQAATISLDAFRMKVFKLNEELGISKGLAGFMETAAINVGTFQSAVLALATTALPLLANGIKKVTLSLARNPLTIGLVATSFVLSEFAFNTEHSLLRAQVAIAAFNLFVEKNFGNVAEFIRKIPEAISYFSSAVSDFGENIYSKIKVGFDAIVNSDIAKVFYSAAMAVTGFILPIETTAISMRSIIGYSSILGDTIENFSNKISPAQKKVSNLSEVFLTAAKNAIKMVASVTGLLPVISAFESSSKDVGNNIDKNIKKSESSFDSAIKRLKEFEEAQKQANRSFQIQKYVDALKNSAENLNVNKKIKGIALANQELQDGLITTAEYFNRINNISLDELKQDFLAGKIEVVKFNQELIKMEGMFNPGSALFVGVSEYIGKAGTISQNVASVVNSTFGHLEDTMVEFIETGKANFADFTNAVLKDLNRIIIRSLLIRPLAQGVLGSLSPSLPSSGQTQAADQQLGPGADYYDSYSAKGNAFFNGRIQKFARGGLVDQPTLFNYGGGKSGLMGEAGTEAIMPLKRTSSGDLGVSADIASNVEVNVINNSGSQAETRERRGPNGERVIDVIIKQKVGEIFGSGQMDNTMKNRYGLSRKGT